MKRRGRKNEIPFQFSAWCHQRAVLKKAVLIKCRSGRSTDIESSEEIWLMGQLRTALVECKKKNFSRMKDSATRKSTTCSMLLCLLLFCVREVRKRTTKTVKECLTFWRNEETCSSSVSRSSLSRRRDEGGKLWQPGPGALYYRGKVEDLCIVFLLAQTATSLTKNREKSITPELMTIGMRRVRMRRTVEDTALAKARASFGRSCLPRQDDWQGSCISLLQYLLAWLSFLSLGSCWRW